jgi:hypothetical protein
MPKIFAENAHCSSFIYIGNILFMKKSVYFEKTEEIQFPEYTGATGETGEADNGAEIGYRLL